MRKISTLIAISLVSGLSYGGYRFFTASYHAPQLSTSTATTAKTIPATPTIATHTIDSDTLSQEINALLDQYSTMDVSVSIADISTGKTFQYGDDAGYVAASVTKLITACLYLHEVESGNASMTTVIDGTSANDLLQALIVNSDNTAWTSLNNYLGATALSNYASSIGMASYDESTNLITSQDIALLLTKLYKQQLLNSSNTNLLLSYMQQANYASYIPAAVSSSITVYHKAGVLDDRFHDAAILYDGTHAYVLVIFSKTSGAYNATAGQALFHAISAASSQTILGKS